MGRPHSVGKEKGFEEVITSVMMRNASVLSRQTGRGWDKKQELKQTRHVTGKDYTKACMREWKEGDRVAHTDSLDVNSREEYHLGTEGAMAHGMH
jgi:hypothetical protein